MLNRRGAFWLIVASRCSKAILMGWYSCQHPIVFLQSSSDTCQVQSFSSTFPLKAAISFVIANCKHHSHPRLSHFCAGCWWRPVPREVLHIASDAPVSALLGERTCSTLCTAAALFVLACQRQSPSTLSCCPNADKRNET